MRMIVTSKHKREFALLIVNLAISPSARAFRKITFHSHLPPATSKREVARSAPSLRIPVIIAFSQTADNR